MVAQGRRDRAEDAAVLATGTVFHGAYEVIGCIKSGGMGSVYEVVQRNTERRRALKVMLPSLVSDPELRARFELEAKVAAGIESEHIVETLDAGVDDATGMPFIVMELLKGEEIGKLLKAKIGSTPAAIATKGDEVVLAYMGSDGKLYDQVRKPDMWSPAGAHGTGSLSGPPAIVSLASGPEYLLVFSVQPKGPLQWMTRSLGSWTAPAPIAGTPAAEPAIVALPSGAAVLAYRNLRRTLSPGRASRRASGRRRSPSPASLRLTRTRGPRSRPAWPTPRRSSRSSTRWGPRFPVGCKATRSARRRRWGERA
jgi:hypothetical protein